MWINAIYGDFVLVKRPSIQEIDPEGVEAVLTEAVKANEVAFVSKCLGDTPEELTDKLYFVALRDSTSAMVAQFLGAGKSIDLAHTETVFGLRRSTPLIVATAACNLEVMEYLLTRGCELYETGLADIEWPRPNFFWNALYYAVRTRNPQQRLNTILTLRNNRFDVTRLQFGQSQMCYLLERDKSESDCAIIDILEILKLPKHSLNSASKKKINLLGGGLLPHTYFVHTEVVYSAGLQETPLDALSCAGSEFDNGLLEYEAVDVSMKLEGDNYSLSTEQLPSAEDTPQTSSPSAQSSERSVASPAEDNKVMGGDYVCNPDCTCKMCDTCFGMIQTSFLNSNFVPDQDQSPTGVRLELQEELVSLYHENSGKFAGVADRTTGQVMGRLSKQFMVAYRRSIVPHDHSKQDSLWKYKLQTSIYGLREDAGAVGALLSTKDVFLQQAQEINPTKLYLNPHYLSWPGRNKDIPQNNISSGIVTYPDESVLDELAFVKPQIASSLKTTLKDYQILALAMMFEKENEVIQGANFPSLWQGRDFLGEKRYYNVFTKAFEEQDAELRRGGLIADDWDSRRHLLLWHLLHRQLP
ncbi:uncharacterized protein A1O9_11331 [Exophiala aquamarina CBS 119918]|uniref:Uncharacterized protein n=1 Tax=Exophiala aquamarina CBS 119918 TaxID=1182545 RepID=A0A072NX95_9EURO|nr:uncharacterized protein A1O9_11331 [Exophiala aquamarina CBS 119918]KEF52489.1 hypothetical protein A1O9_11331 [Exophiala aquamarina CBS 119918]